MNRTHWRLILCALLACIAGDYARSQIAVRPVPPDIAQVWYAARAVLHGQNPYALIGPGRAFEWPAPLFYPLPAALVAVPIAPFPERTAVFLFVALGVGALCWALTTDGWGGLWALTSISVQQAVLVAQWSPLLAGATALAPLAVILVAKPTVGAAVFAYRPSKWAIGGAIALTLLAFLLQPGWMPEWHHALTAASVGRGSPFPYLAPIAQPGGILVLLALMRWRRPEARLLVALACVPQTMLPYEGVLLFLIPRGWRQMLALSALSWASTILARQVMGAKEITETILAYAQTMTLLLYLPCLLMVLRRPNEGPVPAALGRWLSGLHQRFVFARRVRVLAHHVADLIPRDARTVLDVGCGDGTLARHLMARRPELTITGLELSARPETAIPVETFDGERIPKADASADVVLFVDVLHHADNPHALLHEAERVARQAVIVKDHYADPWLGYLRLHWMDWAGNAAHGVNLRTVYRTRAAWALAFQSARLAEEERRFRLGLYPLPMRWLFESGLHFVSRLRPTRA
jgi:SAM-dependent methyltransferase